MSTVIGTDPVVPGPRTNPALKIGLLIAAIVAFAVLAAFAKRSEVYLLTVSYTHLTLPTICSV